MSLTLRKQQTPPSFGSHPKRQLSLSTYFPSGTQYFYGYPAGEDSGFLNRVPPSVEELVAARPFSCAGDHVSVVSFAATTSPSISETVMDAFNIPRLDPRQLIVLPAEIDSRVHGAKRNKVIKESLIDSTNAKSLIMAQPFTGEDMVDFYQIPAKLTRWLNDKSTMGQYIASHLLPDRLAVYENGAAFAKNYAGLGLPLVVKAASSSAGDGVFMCRTSKQLKQAVKQLKGLKSTILVEDYIEVRQNFGVHFGIPHKRSQPIDILGVNEQMTTPEGEFIAGIIGPNAYPEALDSILSYMVDNILPKIRDMGWYGVGCFDVLLDTRGKMYFIDSNFRMTAMSAYHFLVANRTLSAPLMSFSGSLRGSRQAFMDRLWPHAGKHSHSKIAQLIALNRQGNSWNFNGAILFEDREQLREHVRLLLEAGVKSAALEQIG